MKQGIISIILALVGILLVIWFNIGISELFKTEFLKQLELNEPNLNPVIFSTGKEFKIIAFGIAIIGFVLGVKSSRKNELIGFIGVFLSLVLSFVAFYPIWKFFVQGVATDINFAN
jgi:hypothetical protein